MCLIVITGKSSFDGSFERIPYVKVSDEDIKVYKIVKKIGKKYMSPFQDDHISRLTMKGILKYKAHGKKVKEDEVGVESEFGNGVWNTHIYDGVIHTMSSLVEVKDFARYINDNYRRTGRDTPVEIWECVIPRGTKYMEGMDSNGYMGMGSRCIRFVERVY